jgi:hypothetical protein
MDELDRYWLAGLMEGEGSFLRPMRSAPNRPVVALNMTDEDVVQRVANLLGVSYRPHSPNRYASHGWTPSFMLVVRGAKAARLMRDLYPLLGQRRRAQIDRALADYRPREPKITEAAARELARRYHAGERRPTALAREFGGISKNLAIYYIDKYAPS